MPTNSPQFNHEMKLSETWAEKEASKAVRSVSLELFRRIVLKTPVDTGRARGNWHVTTEAPSEIYNWEMKDQGGGKTVAAAVEALANLDLSKTITLFNNIPYIVYLEGGRLGVGKPRSAQAPRGMVLLSISELKTAGYFS